MDLTLIPTPAYVVDAELLIRNAKILETVQKRTGAKILLALKAFSMFSVFPILKPYLAGTTASSLYEARLGYEEFGKESHIFSPAYIESEFPEILRYVDHISFNSIVEWQKFKPYLQQNPKKIAAFLRLNPEHSEVSTGIYDPCSPYSRLGITLDQFDPNALDGLSGFHMHTLCQQNADALERTVYALTTKFGKYFHQIQYLNLGGGHHITRSDYDIDLLCRLIDHLQTTYNLQVILEPGEAVALNAGYLVASVLGFVHNGMEIAILDTSAATHMPDVLEMPYRPEMIGADQPGKHAYTYRLAGNTCLSGDIIGDYSFPEPLTVGQKLVFTDMAHYSMVKNNTFNGIRLPTIGIWTSDQTFQCVKQFGYDDFKMRLS